MKDWETKFDENTLERGKKTCMNRRVMNLRQDGDIYRAGVLSRTRSEVTIKMRDGSPVQMSCSCPVPKSGRNCEHMAAVLYAIEMLNNPGEQNPAEEGAAAESPVKKRGGEASGKRQEKSRAVVGTKEAGTAPEASKKEEQAAEDEKKKEETAAAPKKPRKKRMTKAEKLLMEQEKAEEEKKRREAEQAALKEEMERKLEEAKKRTEEMLRQERESREQERLEQERQEKRDARKKRKEEKARREEERRKKAEEVRNKEYERLRAEEKKREEIKKQQELEEQRRAEKRRLEQEAARLADERRRREEEQQKALRRKKRSTGSSEKEKPEEQTVRNRNANDQGNGWLMEDDWDEEDQRVADQWEKSGWLGQAEEEAQEWMRQQETRRKNELAWQARKGEFSETPNPVEEEDTDTEDADRRLAALEKYTYFKGKKICRSVKIPRDVQNMGEKLLSQGRILLNEVTAGHERTSGEVLGQMSAFGEERKYRFSMELIFSHSEVRQLTCGCSKCRGEYYTWNPKSTSCPYKAGLLMLMEEYLDKYHIGDATDQKGMMLLNTVYKKHENRVLADVSSSRMNLRLEPRLIRSGGRLALSFRVGENRMYVVKKLDEFCRHVKNSETALYGTTTQINHSPDNFTEEGKDWIRFINQIVREEQEFTQRLIDSRRYYYGWVDTGVGSSLNLYGWRLDEFYKRLADRTVEFEDKDGPDKKKGTLSAANANPKVTMEITADEDPGGGREFHGIRVKGTLPRLYAGTDYVYFIDGEHFNRADGKFIERIEPLTRLSSGDQFSFQLGRNHMAQFYYDLLPQLEDIVDVTETEPEKFRAYLPPQVSFVFYLDAEDSDMTCRIYARYGKKEFSVFDTADPAHETVPFRDEAKENEILFLASQWFPEMDWDKDELFCGGDEQRMYRVLESGVEQLMELGEVHCTRRFLNRRVISRVKMSVGVSVAGGMLDLTVTTDDISQDELLDILKSYKLKKKYYRLKNGDFVNLEEQNLQMLAELVDSMHVKPKELIQGRMHLPMFRTLYLDRMLEENEDIYSRRDSHFREIIKGFKTVKDADYEEPESLSGIMRKYQKDGFKWLRTLETWKFGGILADEMGLGKTLQVISVLLAAKQEQQETAARTRAAGQKKGRKRTKTAEQQEQTETAGYADAGSSDQMMPMPEKADGQNQLSTEKQAEGDVSLVVAPASLVFNWGEEFRRFAPELTVVLVTGTQEERRRKIERWQEADVLVTSYDLLKRDIAYYEDKMFRYEIIDEAQYIKNHTTAAAKAVKVVSSQIRFALTGTPIENRLSELWSIFDYLMPGFLYGYDVFRKELEIPIVKNNDEEATKRLQKMVNPFILRRLKQDVLRDLPEKLEEIRYVRFGGTQQKLYDGQVVHMKERLLTQSDDEFSRNKIQILAELTRLRQICCAPQLCFEDYHGEAAKVEACLDLVQSAIDGEHRILLFSQFTSMLDLLQKRFDEAKIPYFVITGSTPKAKRLQLVKEFNEGSVPLFLISLKAGGVGLNLTGADVVIHYDPWWNQAVQNQATDRAHRIGQTKKVTVYKLLVKNSIEEKIQKLQEEKGNLAEQIIGGETGQLGSMSREELLALL